MTCTLETVLLVNKASVASQPMMGSNALRQNTGSFADIFATPSPVPRESALAVSIQASIGVASKTPARQPVLANPPGAKSWPNSKPRVSTSSLPQLLPTAPNPIPVSEVLRSCEEADEDLFATPTGLSELADYEPNLSGQTATASAIGVPEILPGFPVTEMPAKVSQLVDLGSNDRIGERSAGDTLQHSISVFGAEPAPTAIPSAETLNLTAVSAVSSIGQADGVSHLADELAASSIPLQASWSSAAEVVQSEIVQSDPIAAVPSRSGSDSSVLSIQADSSTQVDRYAQDQRGAIDLDLSISQPGLLPVVNPPDAKPNDGTLPSAHVQPPHGNYTPDQSFSSTPDRVFAEPMPAEASSQTLAVPFSTITSPSHASAAWSSTLRSDRDQNTGLTYSDAVASSMDPAAKQLGNSSARASSSIPISNSATQRVDSSAVGSSTNSEAASGNATQVDEGDPDLPDSPTHKVPVSPPASAAPVSSAPVPVASVVQPGPASQVTPAPTTEAPIVTSKPDAKDSTGRSDSSSNLAAFTDLPPSTPAGPVQMAQIVSKAAAQSEMRIDLNTSAFGSVEVRAVVHANDVGVMIGSEKGDLRSLLINDLPGISNSLQQRDLRLHEVNFQQQGFAFSSDSSAGGHAQTRSFVPKPIFTASLAEPMASEPNSTAEPNIIRAGGLSVLA